MENNPVQMEALGSLRNRLARGIVKAKNARSSGAFLTTSENGFACLALGRYFERISADSDTSMVEFFYGRQCVKEVELCSQDSCDFSIPMNQLSSTPTLITVHKPGGAPCFIEIALRSARQFEFAEEIFRNFEIQRRFYPSYDENEFCS